jgi:hypothetical protein
VGHKIYNNYYRGDCDDDNFFKNWRMKMATLRQFMDFADKHCKTTECYTYGDIIKIINEWEEHCKNKNYQYRVQS